MLTALLSMLAAFAGAAPGGGYEAERVERAAREAGFGTIAQRLARASRPTVTIGRTITRRPARALGTSRFGGPPDMPAGARWPQCGGRAQSFLAQVRLRDLPRPAGALRRHGGTLLMFTAIEFEVPAERLNAMWAGDCSTVIHARPGAPLRRTAPPTRIGVKVLRPAGMRFRAVPDIPDEHLDTGDLTPPLDHLAPGASWRGYDALRHGLRGRPALEHRLLGYVDQPNGYEGPCYGWTTRPRGTWRHLFTLGWDEPLKWTVADAGRLQLAIGPRDLRRGRFDRVCGLFDSA